MSHRSAPLTPAGRRRLVRRCQRRPIAHGAPRPGCRGSACRGGCGFTAIDRLDKVFEVGIPSS